MKLTEKFIRESTGRSQYLVAGSAETVLAGEGRALKAQTSAGGPDRVIQSMWFTDGGFICFDSVDRVWLGALAGGEMVTSPEIFDVLIELGLGRRWRRT
tara:strand:+ start:1717 stop:2013 length:297 start_codon:yes stop_codon:yes gene_type:complete